MGDNLAELLYMAWRSERLPFEPDLPSWGNVRDPDVRRAWEAAATKARAIMAGRFVGSVREAMAKVDNDHLGEHLDRLWSRA